MPGLPDPRTVADRVAERPGGARLLEALRDLAGVHLVGGAVRDLLLGREPEEWDLLAEEDGEAVAKELRRRLGGRGRVHERFGTASVETDDGLKLDVATARAESYPRPGALPVVRAGTLADDMARRDFTVNAIAVGLSQDRRGLVHHAEQALDDLAARRLRVLHDASFADDPTRLLRLARYAARLGFAIEPHTLTLARDAVAAGATAGPARMGSELMLLLREELPVAVAGLGVLRDLGLDGAALDAGVAERAAALLGDAGRRDLLLLAALGRGRARGDLGRCLAAMHVSPAEPVLDAADDPEGLAERMRAARRPSELHALLRRRAAEAVALAGAHGAETPARRWLGELRHVELRIGGHDLLAAGVPQGPEIRRRLDAALAHKLDEGAATREDELAAALRSEP